MNRFWECTCCSCSLSTLPQDDATNYKCPQCTAAHCSEEHLFKEITVNVFIYNTIGENVTNYCTFKIN